MSESGNAIRKIRGFQDVFVSAYTEPGPGGEPQVCVSQGDQVDGQGASILFPPDRADAVIAAIKAVKREIAAKPETPAA